jgi:hypothetical protein
MKSRTRSRRGLGPIAATVLTALVPLGCSDDDSKSPEPAPFVVDTTRLCALVPARDATLGNTFPQPPPIEVWGTDLGWTYEVNGRIPILFGDTWQRIDICPVQVNDDSLGTLHLPANDWPGFDATDSIPDSQCLDITYEIDEAGTAFAPITLHRWDGVAVPLGPLNTPVVGFYDGQREWAVFIVGGGQRCTPAEVASGAACSDDLSPQATELVCGTVAGQGSCVDPTSTRGGDGAQALYLHIAERVGPAAYVSRAMFLTNKYLNLTGRTVRAFDPDDPGGRDYEPGQASLLLWGRPAFDDLSGDGEAPPYFMYHPLPLEVSDDRIVFAPQYFRGLVDGQPSFSSQQVDAVPLYTGELEPVNHVAISWVSPIAHWVMIYSGSSTDFIDPDLTTGRGQPVKGAMYARVAREPWGPWSDFQPVLTNEQTAQDLVCGHQAPVGCIPPPDPLIRPGCLEAVDPLGGGNLYGANIIDQMTRVVPTSSGGFAADVFWLYSTWHPYSVILARTRVETE